MYACCVRTCEHTINMWSDRCACVEQHRELINKSGTLPGDRSCPDLCS